MANLRKYQVDAVKSEVRQRFKDKESEILASREFIDKREEIARDLIEELEYGKYVTLQQRKEQLESELAEIKEEVQELESYASDVLGCKVDSYSYRGKDMGDAIDEASKKEAMNEIGFSIPSNQKINNAIIISDLNDAEDVIETVVEKLSQESG